MQTEARRVRALDAVFSLLILAGVANFAYHAIQGEYGVFAMMRFQAEEREAERELAELRQDRARLENLTARLGEESLDLDLLDERVRAVLGHMRDDELTLR
jgi:cell division protein FtsB